MYRQGDVLLREVETERMPGLQYAFVQALLDDQLLELMTDVVAPQVLTGKAINPENGKHILAYGEATGHHHAVSASTSVLVEVPNSERVLIVGDYAPFTHQQHATIDIFTDLYFVVGQREYTPEAPRRVID